MGYKQFSRKLVDIDESGDYDEDDTSIDDSFRLSKRELHSHAASAVWSQVYVFAVRCCIAYCQAQERIPIFTPFLLCYCLLRMMSSRKIQELPLSIVGTLR